ncbi:MAG: cytochrome c [Sneathiella sp.]
MFDGQVISSCPDELSHSPRLVACPSLIKIFANKGDMSVTLMRAGLLLSSIYFFGLQVGNVIAAEVFLGDAVEGKTLVESLCSRCHGTQTDTESPFISAPLLIELANKWPLDSLSEAFAEGITVGHPAMPAFEFTSREIEDLLEYLETLQY